LERLLDRESQTHGGLTNGWQNVLDDSPWKISRNRDDASPFDPGDDNTVDAAKRLSEYLNSRRMGEGTDNRNDKAYGWDSFSQPAPQTTAKPDLEQMAAMDRFRQLLNPRRRRPPNPHRTTSIFRFPKPPRCRSLHYPAGLCAESRRLVLHAVDQRLRQAGRPDAAAGIVSPGIAPTPAPAWHHNRPRGSSRGRSRS